MVFLVINVITIQLIQYFDKFCSTMTMNCTVEWTLEKCQKTFQTFLNTLLFKATFLFFEINKPFWLSGYFWAISVVELFFVRDNLRLQLKLSIHDVPRR